MLDLGTAFKRDGFALCDRLLAPGDVEALTLLADPLLTNAHRARPGVRRVFEKQPAFIEAIQSTPIPSLLRTLTPGEPRVVRTILFDKSPGANWMVPWHQDAVIAVRERRDVEGFGPWSIKDDEPHCRPPREILDRIGVLRINLDPCGLENGPLRVIPGSHAHGLVDAATLDELVSQGSIIDCCTQSGGVVLMRPHTIHSSPRAASSSRRRVLHLEFTDAHLPGGLEWAELTSLEATGARFP